MDTEGQTTNQPLLAPSQEMIAAVKVFPLIHHIKRDIEENIDTALTWEQLTASDVNFAVVRPLVHKYAKLSNIAVVYAFLVVRSHFLATAEDNLAFANVRISRAAMCELMAIKMVRHFASHPIELVAVLTISWTMLAGAPDNVIQEIRETLGDDYKNMEEPMSALEMAISTNSKQFLSSPLVQSVIDDIYSGRVVFSNAATRSLLADNYKTRQIEFYDSRSAPFLDHYRLRVPKYGAILEFVNFTILLITFLFCVFNKDFEVVTKSEIVFIVFASAFVLEEYAASREHGWNIYMANMWNAFDSLFVIIFLAYLGFRVHGLVKHDLHSADLAFDILACGAVILFPRLAFFAISNNVVILALQGMIAEFAFFIVIAIICFSGLLFTFWDLAAGKYTVKWIAWLMIQIWMGNTYLSFAQAETFHPIFGPPLMVLYAALSNTLLITILISILSNTFARIDKFALQEHLFQHAITTIEGFKSDALFSYQPPFNLFAYAILFPLSLVVSPRTFHTINVFMIRLTTFPILVTISIYERYLAPGQKFVETSKGVAGSFFNSLPRPIKSVALLEAIIGSNTNDLMEAIFEMQLDEDQYNLFNDDAGVSTPFQQSPRMRGRRSLPQSPGLGASGAVRSRSRTPQGVTPTGLPAPPSPFIPQVEVTEPTPSPLARLFGARLSTKAEDVNANGATLDDALSGIRRLEARLENVKEMPAADLKKDIKDLQERQARIEELLVTLTKGMRG